MGQLNFYAFVQLQRKNTKCKKYNKKRSKNNMLFFYTNSPVISWNKTDINNVNLNKNLCITNLNGPKGARTANRSHKLYVLSVKTF